VNSEKRSFKSLTVKEITEVIEEAKVYIDHRKSGKERSLRVGSDKVNQSFMGGFDWNRIITLAGMPGSGKSTLLRQWIKEFVELNLDQEFEILNFQFEMLGVDELAKDVSSKTQLTLKEIYSATESLADAKQKRITEILDSMKEYPISVVDNLGTVANIKDTILSFCATKDLAKLNKGLVVTMDHSLLVKAENREDEKTKVDNLFHTLVALKKYLHSIGIKAMFIILHQLNRNIESVERVTNSNLHFPNKTDLFAASSVYYSSDYVIIIHRPCLIEGLRNWYGPAADGKPGLPIFNPQDQNQPMIYLHIIKERFGETQILSMLDELKYSRIVEYHSQ